VDGRKTPRMARKVVTRRQVIAGGAAATAAWLTPSILVAKPASGAVLSGTNEELEPPSVAAESAPTEDNPLAFTGANLEQNALLGAALVGGGWAMHHWAARKPETP